jgi:ATP-dependent DNA helicase RecQ
MSYFGEESDTICDNCDNCRTGLARRQLAETKEAEERGRPFAVGAKVVHRKFGPGVVRRYEGNTVVILFAPAGSKAVGREVGVGWGLVKEG